MKRTGFVFHTILIGFFVLLQTTVFSRIDYKGVNPDFVLILLAFSSTWQGSEKGQLTGFLIGILEDFLSLSPMGFNALIKTVIGFVYGRFKGKLFIDIIFIPVILAVTATIIKILIGFLLSIIFIKNGNATISVINTLIELGMNVIISPFIYILLKYFKIIRIHER